MIDKQHIIFNKGECLSRDMLLRYMNDQLTAKEKHAVEKHSLACELCADALDGAMQMKEASKLEDILLNIDKKITIASEKSKPIILWRNPLIAIAAGLALLIGLFFLFNNNLNKSNDRGMLSDNLIPEEVIGKSTATKEENFKTTSEDTDAYRLKANDIEAKEVETVIVEDSEILTTKDAGQKQTNNGDDSKKQSRKNTQSDLLRAADAPAPQAALQEEKPKLNYAITNEPSKLAFIKKQSEQKIMIEKDSKTDGELPGSIPTRIIAQDNLAQAPVQSQGLAESHNNKKSKKAEAADLEEMGLALNKSEKGEHENLETAKHQKLSEGANFVNGSDNVGYAAAPQSPEAKESTNLEDIPSMAPESNTGEKTISMLKNSEGESLNSIATKKTKMDSEAYQTEIRKGKKRYESKEYEQAVLHFTKVLQIKPADPEALYFLGCAYLKLSKPEMAIVQFDMLINSAAIIYYDGARFNKAKALIKQNKITEAKILLEAIIKTSAKYKSRATKALAKIK